MCCGSKRTALRSVSTSTPPPRAAPAPAPVAARPAPAPPRPNAVTQQAELGRAAVSTPTGPFRSSASQQGAPLARSVRRWSLTS
jgi:hypothetical protein